MHSSFYIWGLQLTCALVALFPMLSNTFPCTPLAYKTHHIKQSTVKLLNVPSIY